MERRAIEVRGIVQGVGFRPFVFNLASQLELTGFVRNRTGNVQIEIEGQTDRLDAFVDTLSRRPPPLAQIDGVDCRPARLLGDSGFRIETSEFLQSSKTAIFISPDIAMCDQCRAELFDPHDRRYRYPFLNCTNCGPRLTIIRGAPYDRQRTTMAEFPMCPACRAEYENPRDRRFHAQPTACPICGPKLQLCDASGQPMDSSDPLVDFAHHLERGQIGALKGLGGFHLCCLANDESAVAQLRRRKHREDKPFAIMVADVDAAAGLVEMNDLERRLLTSNRRPIVLMRRRPNADLAPSVAPGNPYIGIMLPYTPLHELLLREMNGPLVMTSGNRSDEPIAYENADAVERLSGVADLFLLHNRAIAVRCDDSVTRVIAGREAPVRRSRGYAPQPVRLPVACAVPTLAMGGQLKSTFALGRGDLAFISHHLGDLDHLQAYHAFERDLTLYRQLFDIHPKLIAHDMHPDYSSTLLAQRLARDTGCQLLAVQHHHAHMASCMAEHGLNEPVIGVSFDGTGYGTDGAIWGGEFFVGDYRHVRRAAHLQYVPMPGGERAIRQPWRMALAHLHAAGCPADRLTARLPCESVRIVEQMIQRRFNTPITSSMGRLFDAVAAMVGVRDQVNYEGQAAIELEWLADGEKPDGAYPFAPICNPANGRLSQPMVISTNELVKGITHDLDAGVKAATVARRFHSSIVAMIAGVCEQLRNQTQLNKVALSGGVFMNALLVRETCDELTSRGFGVYRHHQVPANDGGVSLGQLAVAAVMSAQNNLR